MSTFKTQKREEVSPLPLSSFITKTNGFPVPSMQVSYKSYWLELVHMGRSSLLQLQMPESQEQGAMTACDHPRQHQDVLSGSSREAGRSREWVSVSQSIISATGTLVFYFVDVLVLIMIFPGYKCPGPTVGLCRISEHVAEHVCFSNMLKRF